MRKNIIEVNALSKYYNRQTLAINKINFTVKEGEWITITGPSGSGKTTLLNMIGTLDTPSSGKVIIDGIDTSNLSNNELTVLRREKLGFIFQQFHLIPYLTALENVMLSQYLHSITDKAEAMAKLDEIGLGHRMNHTPAHLSGGEQQRVCIVRALINEPGIIMADEPTGNLDRKNGEIVLRHLKELHKAGHTIILITHNPEIAHMGDKVMVLEDGEITKYQGNID